MPQQTSESQGLPHNMPQQHFNACIEQVNMVHLSGASPPA